MAAAGRQCNDNCDEQPGKHRVPRRQTDAHLSLENLPCVVGCCPSDVMDHVASAQSPSPELMMMLWLPLVLSVGFSRELS
jgi:hypothetical protein